MKKTLLLLLFSLSLFSTKARILSISATLNGANVVPANASVAMGTLTGTFDDVSNLVTWSISSNVSNISGYGFHQGSAGTNNTAFSSQPTNVNPFSGSSSFWTTGNIADLLAGNVYVDINSSGSPSGEIRGQIIIGMEIFNNAARNDFYGIGGYSYTQTTFPNGVQANPYIVSGPSPQNDFSFAVSAVGGINNIQGLLRTATVNTSMNLKFFGNNVRKFGCRVKSIDLTGLNEGTDEIRLTATTNLGNTASQTGSLFPSFVGFKVINENEYITNITAEFVNATVTQMVTLRDIIIGDDSPQNVALNFDGVDDYVSIPSTVGNFGTNDNFTVTCWIKPDATQPSSAINPDENDIISKWAGTGTGSNNNYPFVIRYLNSTNANPNKILVGQWDGTTFTTVTSTATVSAGKWYHVAFVRGATGFSLYIDGILQGTAVADNVTGTTTNTTPLQIGRRGNGQNYFRGEIDEVRIWNVAKTAIQIDDEKFCKTPLSANLVSFYNFNNGVPHNNNALISQVNEASFSTNNGTLNNFAKTGDASNFVTGQVRYVKKDATGSNNGSSWANAFIDLQSALINYSCNNLFDVYVAKGNAAYKPAAPNGNVSTSFSIPSGMRIYGGFAGTEKSINQRNMALIHSTNKTTLSGDLNGNDTPFNFTINRGDNSDNPVYITGNNVVFDGFTVSGSSDNGAGIRIDGTNATIKNSRIIDNTTFGLNILGDNATIANCSIMGNKDRGIYIENSTTSIKESLIANNGLRGVYIFVNNGTRQTTITNSTIASNATFGIIVTTNGGTSTNTLKNTLIYDNAMGAILNIGGTINNTITYSLVQGQTSTANGNLNGNTVNPQFVSPLAAGIDSLNLNNLGDYRLKWCSRAIGAGDNAGISPLDLDRKPRNFNTTTDMGAYEFLGNTPSQVNNSSITGTIDSPTYAGGAIQTITSTAKILAPAGAIDFKAPNSITLNPGFEARGVGQYFKAEIGANSVCTN